MSLLQIKHCKQENNAGCLAACAQMALNALTISQSQADLNKLLGLTVAGVPFSQISRLSQFGIQVTLSHGDEQALQTTIDAQKIPLVFVNTGQLSYWSESTQHAVVVVGYSTATFTIFDPAKDDAPYIIDQDELMLAWVELDYWFATIG